ncbi:MAG: hypothetical protein RLZZ381_1016 [Cyanobacteriota bacterium]|jgi:hypothetical protein
MSAIAHNFKRQIKNKRVTHQFLQKRSRSVSRRLFAKSPLIPLPSTKINTLAVVPFRTSSVSPAPIEAEKK